MGSKQLFISCTSHKLAWRPPAAVAQAGRGRQTAAMWRLPWVSGWTGSQRPAGASTDVFGIRSCSPARYGPGSTTVEAKLQRNPRTQSAAVQERREAVSEMKSSAVDSPGLRPDHIPTPGDRPLSVLPPAARPGAPLHGPSHHGGG
ncbi:unnamed protein product [Arctogadus glacialis]